MMTKEDARRFVEQELSSSKLAQSMSPSETLLFCQRMYNQLDFKSRSDRLGDIRAWAENWQRVWLGSRFD